MKGVTLLTVMNDEIAVKNAKLTLRIVLGAIMIMDDVHGRVGAWTFPMFPTSRALLRACAKTATKVCEQMHRWRLFIIIYNVEKFN